MAGPHGDRDIWPDNLKEVAAWSFFISIIVTMAFVWYSDPYFLHELEVGESGGGIIAAGGPSSDFQTDPLTIDADDAYFLNRIFEERTHEIGYCAFLKDRRLQPYLADTISASMDSLTFSMANCPGSSRPPATIHTHPSGNLWLSINDRTNFIGKGYRFMCVQGGSLPTEEGMEAEALACYKTVSTGNGVEYKRVPVLVVDQSA